MEAQLKDDFHEESYKEINFPNVLYFLNCEARRFEKDRLEWGLEKQELQTKEILPEFELNEKVNKNFELPSVKARNILKSFFTEINEVTGIEVPVVKEEKHFEEKKEEENENLGELAELSLIEEASRKTDPVVPSIVEIPNWKLKISLKGHLDTIRSVDFHPSKPIILTASDDNCIKMWNLQSCYKSKKASQSEIESNWTFREHDGAVHKAVFCKNRDEFFSAGVDCAINHWALPASDCTAYDPSDQGFLKNSLAGHTDIVWDLVVHPTIDGLVVSSSADGSIRVWNVDSSNSLKKTFWFAESHQSNVVPTCLTFLNYDSSKILASFSNGKFKIFDIMKGVGSDAFEDYNFGLVNSLSFHPTMDLAIAACEDKTLKFLNTKSESIAAHLDAVTCVQANYDNLSASSASRDGSIRIWDIGTKNCVQEISSVHRQKFAESVTALSTCSQQLMASGGADSIVKIFYC